MTLVANLGVSTAAAVALIWFLYTLVSQTLPRMMDLFREELDAQRIAHEQALATEREYRVRERIEILAAATEFHRTRHEETLKVLDRLDFGFKELLGEIEELRERIDARK